MDTLTRDPMGSTPNSTLQQCDGWLVCLRAADSYKVRFFDEWDEAIEVYDDGDRGWYSTAMFGCQRGIPIAHLTYADISQLRRS